MGFVQIIEMKTSRIEELRAVMDQWLAATEGKRTAQRATIGRDANRDGYYLQIVEFPSREAAMQNSELPETQQISAQMAGLCEKVSFYDVVDTETMEL